MAESTGMHGISFITGEIELGTGKRGTRIGDRPNIQTELWCDVRLTSLDVIAVGLAFKIKLYLTFVI